MRKLLLLPILVTILFSCGQQITRYDVPLNDIEFDSYRLTYEIELESYLDKEVDTSHIPIAFGSDSKFEEDVVGKCYRWESSNGDYGYFIIVHQEFWESNSEATKEALIFHELGHCHLGLKHDEDSRIYENNYVQVANIMYPNLTQNWEYDSSKMESSLKFMFDQAFGSTSEYRRVIDGPFYSALTLGEISLPNPDHTEKVDKIKAVSQELRANSECTHKHHAIVN